MPSSMPPLNLREYCGHNIFCSGRFSSDMPISSISVKLKAKMPLSPDFTPAMPKPLSWFFSDTKDTKKPPVRQAVRYERPRYGDGDGLLNNIKTSIPEFKDLHDPDLYLYWERKVDKIFTCYDFPEIKKVQDRYPHVDTWEEMKGFLRGRFIPVHYQRELEKKLNRIKQGTRSIEEYHKELETVLNRVGKRESLNATIIRYIEGMNPDITYEVELRDFTSVDDMVHYASIVERQLREGRRRSHHNAAPTRPSLNKGTPPTSSSTPSTDSTRPQGQSGPPEWCFNRSTPQPNRRPESTSVPPTRPLFQQPNQPNAAPNRARDVQCHKCQGWYHFQNQCPNRCVLFLNDHNGLESASEDKEETQADAIAAVDTLEVEQEDKEPELPHVNLISICSLNINREDKEQSQRENIFYTRVGIQDQTCAMIIDSGSVINAISQYDVDKLALTTTKHPKPYKLQWLTDRGSICVTGQVHVSFSVNHFSDTVLCDVIPMDAAHILLGRPWQGSRKDAREFKQERAKAAATAARSAAVNGPTSAVTSPPAPTPNDSLVHGKSSGSAPNKEKNRSLFISVKGVEKALKAGMKRADVNREMHQKVRARIEHQGSRIAAAGNMRRKSMGNHKLPIFSVENYDNWSRRIKVHLCSIHENMWIPKPAHLLTSEEKKLKNLEFVAQAALFQTLDEDRMKDTKNCQTAKEIWDLLADLCKESETIKGNKLQLAVDRYESFKMHSDETISSLEIRFLGIISEMNNLGRRYSNSEMNSKILDNLIEEWDMKIQSVTKLLEKLKKIRDQSLVLLQTDKEPRELPKDKKAKVKKSFFKRKAMMANTENVILDDSDYPLGIDLMDTALKKRHYSTSWLMKKKRFAHVTPYPLFITFIKLPFLANELNEQLRMLEDQLPAISCMHVQLKEKNDDLRDELKRLRSDHDRNESLEDQSAECEKLKLKVDELEAENEKLRQEIHER
ncbi:hypothetical protein C2S53_008000 [Perilla frutescens var. hirtella]|uniref:Retrotransposon gag domain-containing protein n=1 Tax=Perilla frutescens var. hirtella TaxID=608512 RepID=A0AAD4IZY6_PERFH|nr:hypothetical protein C2S53_008000 [Perilla frutescens var. hirtella]